MPKRVGSELTKQMRKVSTKITRHKKLNKPPVSPQELAEAITETNVMKLRENLNKIGQGQDEFNLRQEIANAVNETDIMDLRRNISGIVNAN